MKPIVLLLVLIFLCANITVITAQLPLKRLMIETSLEYSKDNIEQQQLGANHTALSTELLTSNKIGYRFAQHTAAGVSYRYALARADDSSIADLRTITNTKRRASHSFGVYLRHFIPLTGKFYVVPEFGAAYLLTNYSDDTVIESTNPISINFVEQHYHGFEAQLSCKLLYAINSRFAIQATLLSIKTDYNVFESEDLSSYAWRHDIDLDPTSWQFGFVICF